MANEIFFSTGLQDYNKAILRLVKLGCWWLFHIGVVQSTTAGGKMNIIG